MSFFHFFSDPRLEEEEDEDEDDEGPKEGEHEFQLSIDEDYEIGHAFRAEIIPDAILWFTGEIVINSMAKFRIYHVLVIIKFLIFWGLVHSLF